MRDERMKAALKGAVRSVLTGHATIASHCGTRIFDDFLPVVRKKGADYPQITFSVTWGNAAHRLPSSGLVLKIDIWLETNKPAPKTTMDALELAVFDLLHGEVGEAGVTNLNATAFTVRCRVCNLLSSVTLPEPEANLLHTSMTFSVILGTA